MTQWTSTSHLFMLMYKREINTFVKNVVLTRFTVGVVDHPWDCVREVHGTAIASSNGLICARAHSKSGLHVAETLGGTEAHVSPRVPQGGCLITLRCAICI